MKKIFLILTALAIYQHHEKLEKFFFDSPTPVAARSDVVLYSTSWCGYCQKTRELFDEQGIAYVEYDIEKSDEGRRQYQELNGRGVPLVNANGTIIRGYNKDSILNAVK